MTDVAKEGGGGLQTAIVSSQSRSLVCEHVCMSLAAPPRPHVFVVRTASKQLQMSASNVPLHYTMLVPPKKPRRLRLEGNLIGFPLPPAWGSIAPCMGCK